MADRRIAKQLPVRYFEDAREAEPLVIDRVLIRSNSEVSSVDSMETAFSSNAFGLPSPFVVSQMYTPADIVNEPEVRASGQVYFWNSGTLVENVSITYDLGAGGSPSSVQTDAQGRFNTADLGLDGATLTAGLDVTAADTSRIITAADAFATLKISVGLNPNSDPDGSGPLDADPVSPYQLIAADVNGDGRVTSADAFAILKMAVGASTAIQSQWLFVPEASGYWNPDNGVGTDGGMTVRNVTWDDQGITVDSPSFQTNFVAVLLGDVNGSWSSSRGDLPTLPDTYFDQLQDPAPNFVDPTPTLSISENQRLNIDLFYSNAIDEGNNAGPLTYTLTEDASGLFAIDDTTGALSLVGTLDYESATDYTLVVTVSDQGGNTAEQTISIVVTNVDDFAPIITSSDTATAIDENSGADQVIYTASSDDSADISGGVTYSLTEGSDTGISIDAQSGAVTLSSDPDFETQSAYTFTVIATDAAGNSSEQLVSLSIKNLDDAGPLFISTNDPVTLVENSGANQVIYAAVASDPAGVTYSLAPSTDTEVQFDPMVVSLQDGAFDLVVQDNQDGTYTLEFYASSDAAASVDASLNSFDVTLEFDASQLLPITAADISTTLEYSVTNLEADGYILIAAFGSAPQDLTIYQAVFSVTVTPLTSDAISLVSSHTWFFTERQSNTVSSLQFPVPILSIDPDTGEVTLTSNPDFEDREIYEFTILAEDDLGNKTELPIIVNVQDVENEPNGVVLADVANPLEIRPIVDNAEAGFLVAVSDHSILYSSMFDVGSRLPQAGFVESKESVLADAVLPTYSLLLRLLNKGGSSEAFLVAEATLGEDINELLSLLGGDATNIIDSYFISVIRTSAIELGEAADVVTLTEAGDLIFDSIYGTLIDLGNAKIAGFQDAGLDNTDLQIFEMKIGRDPTDITCEDLAMGIGGFIA